MSAKNELKNLTKSFSYAFKGIAYCVKNERNMRIHICMAVLVSMFSYCYGVNSSQYIFIVICMGLVISGEMINTAIETLTNLEAPSYNRLARIAKDVAAGAVLISAILSMIVGGIIFLNPQRLLDTIIKIVINPIYLISFILAIIISIIFIFKGSKFFKDQKTKIYHMKHHKK